jgi:hypothetical protein
VTAAQPNKPSSELAQLLAAAFGAVAEAERPAFLARLERLAAARYRAWATESPADAAALLACARREEEIAERASRVFPLSGEQAARIDALLPQARETYQAALAGLALREQLGLQAFAERQGAGAWRAFAKAPGLARTSQDELAVCAALEEENAACLDALIAGGRSA